MNIIVGIILRKFRFTANGQALTLAVQVCSDKKVSFSIY